MLQTNFLLLINSDLGHEVLKYPHNINGDKEKVMSNEDLEYQACEACGVSAEMGFIIKEGDDVAEVQIYANGKDALETELENYLALANEVNANYKHEVTPLTEDSQELVARIQFECSAEKLIFELKSRSIAK